MLLCLRFCFGIIIMLVVIMLVVIVVIMMNCRFRFARLRDQRLQSLQFGVDGLQQVRKVQASIG